MRIFLTNDFYSDEFDCPCCSRNEMDSDFILKLQKARDIANTPFIISSGYRCLKHNRNVGGTDHSSHLLGIAADIRAESSTERFKILNGLIRAGFTRIGIGRAFLHCDVDIHKEQGVTWIYN